MNNFFPDLRRISQYKTSLSVCRSQRDDMTPVTSPAMQTILPKGDKDAIMNSIVDSYRSHSKDHHRKKYRKPKKIRKYKIPLETLFYITKTRDILILENFKRQLCWNSFVPDIETVFAANTLKDIKFNMNLIYFVLF